MERKRYKKAGMYMPAFLVSGYSVSVSFSNTLFICAAINFLPAVLRWRLSVS